MRKALTIISLAGLVASLGLWVASYFQASYLAHSHRTFLAVTQGSLWVVRYTSIAPRDGSTWLYMPTLNYWLAVSPVSPENPFLFDTWRTLRTLWMPHFGGDVWSVPLWMPLMACGVVPFMSLMHLLRRRKRRTRGLCYHCGYDLRGSPGNCPECGNLRPAIATMN